MKKVRGDVWRASCVSISVAVLAAAMVVALPGCRDGSGGIGQAPPRLGEPVTSADHLSVQTVLVRGPVVQRVTADGVSILGKPVKSLVNEKITVTVTPGGGKRVSATGRFDEKRDTFVVRVSGLPANTVCSYEVSVGGKSIGPFGFITALAPDDKSTPFRFAVYGDTRTHPDRHKRVADSLLRSGPRFTLVTGDLVGHGPQKSLWDTEFFGPARAMGAYVEMIPCYGNHEARTRYLTDLFDLPGNGHYFTVDYGYVRIITLDLYQKYGPGSEQYEWLKAELARKWDGWVFCQFHQPPFGVHPTRGIDVAVAKNLFPVLAASGVDMIFCGHDHYYMRSKPIAHTKGQRGVVQIVSGGGGAPTYPPEQKPWAAAIYEGLHHVVIDVTPEKLTGTVLTPEDKVIDTFVIEKNGPQPDLIVASEELKEELRR